MPEQPNRPDPTGIDAFKPMEVAARIEAAGVAKAALAPLPLAVLSVMAGVFIALGAAAFTAVMVGTDFTYGPSRFLGGVVFSMGLVLVVVAGAELFTGNTLIVMAWVDHRVSTGALLRNWVYAFFGNLAGATLLALLVWQSGLLSGGVGELARKLAVAKTTIPFSEAIVRGIFGETPPAGLSPDLDALRVAASDAAFSAVAWVTAALCLLSSLTAWISVQGAPVDTPRSGQGSQGIP